MKRNDLDEQRLRLKIGTILVTIACFVALAAVTFGIIFFNFWLLSSVFSLGTDYIKVFWVALCSFIIEVLFILGFYITSKRED
ncbi:hypothetical protein JOC34_000649 [Virgibacillus halotolerans]|uniref:hypothetical protein n=1 Tax=Virgibacillus halotolerans TaxID=1071053 RepID=UPI00195FBA6D|nr:hypothetical protein [Virgibacillus halotolerans]MBM7598292.1 hypothetical protein [Virgibacillus halotolerans]